MTATRSVSILGATGSIGTSTIDLLKKQSAHFRVEAVTANKNVSALAAIAKSLNARFAAIGDPALHRELKDALAGTGIETGAGEEALVEAALRPADWVMACDHRRRRIAADARGRRTRCDCCARQQGMPGLRRRSVHAARRREGRNRAAGRFRTQRVVSVDVGGPRRRCASHDPDGVRWSVPHLRSIEAIRAATPEQALKHPNWSMGAKVTIDSATLMNKGLELIEAHHLFALPSEQIDILVHPQSVVHGMVEFRDGSILAQLGPPDMRVPIAHCLAWPDRFDSAASRLDWTQVANLSFEAARSCPVPGAGARPRGFGGGWGGADNPQRGQ